MAATWLDNAVFYEIYPQSFMDSNADGIGDIPGMTAKLDYVQGLGCNALWINPCFDSPFQDAGYDIRDYKLVAPRYGTNEDLIHFLRRPTVGASGCSWIWFPATPAKPTPGFRKAAGKRPMHIPTGTYGRTAAGNSLRGSPL